jgi:HAD superfamily hydrolase (TIGR01509 family)
MVKLKDSSGSDLALGRMRPNSSLVTIFDVEGTLIDCIAETLECWRQTLAEAGHRITAQKLRSFSGMDGADMLDRLLPHASSRDKKTLLKKQANTYRSAYMPFTKPFPGVRGALTELAKQGCILAIATTCHRDELEHYDTMMHGLDLCDAVMCGDDAKRGKPHPDLFLEVLRKLKDPDPLQVVVIGDTPYDARGAAATGLRSVGVLSGGFSRAELKAANFDIVVSSIRAVPGRIRELQLKSLTRNKTASRRN